MSEARAFDPARHLVGVNGRGEYLEVKWRLVWLRTAHPSAALETQLIELGEGFALFRATVALPGGGSATGYGSETVADFRDFIEKAETKAVGRALAALGFGTQFCVDFDFGAPERLVDAPVERPGGGERGCATARQVAFARRIAAEAGLEGEAYEAYVLEHYNQRDPALLNRDYMSQLIEALQRLRLEVAE